MDEINPDYFKLLGLISHEFFHTWNVKRIKPQAFTPYNLDTENYTKLLWWFEGITSYYDDLILFRAGLIDNKRYLNTVAENINNVYKYHGVQEQSLTNASLTSWVKYYRQDENSPNALVSYYVKGALVGMCLDLLLRIKSAASKSLDDVMRGLFHKWQHDGLGIGEHELPQLIAKYTGYDLSAEIEVFTQSCQDLPLAELLLKFGIVTHIYFSQTHTATGKVIKSVDELPKEQKPDLGCKLVKDSLGYKISNVYTQSLAAQIGLGANDLIIAIDNIKLTDFEKQFALYKIGDTLNLTLFRQEKLLNVNLTLRASEFKVRYLQLTDQVLLSNWL